MKKLISLVLALAMIMMVGAAFAEQPATPVGALTVDTEITVSGLDEGDIVKLFKVLEWEDGKGWKATGDFSSLANGVLKPFIDNEETAAANFSASDLAAIATAAQGKTPINGTDGTTIDSSKVFTYTVKPATATTETAGAGMYLALVTPKTVGTVYNPILVSADFDQKASDDSTAIDASTAKIVGTAVAKKEPVKLLKTEPKITNDIGDTYNYTINTTIPAYSAAFTNTFFKVSDTVSEYLDLDKDSIVISGVTGGTVSVATDLHSFTVEFDHDVVSKLDKATDITITYSAKLNITKEEAAALTNVKEEYNEVTIEFPNDPNDLTGGKVTALKDGTREYTFTIDGKIFGKENWETSELVKVGLNADGTYATQEINYDSGETHGPLEGARFGLYKSKSEAEAARDGGTETAGLYTNDAFDGFVTSSAKGLLNIPGLDAGEYWLAELSAPAGYVKDQDVHKIVIAADINGDADGEQGQAVTEYYTVADDGTVTWSTTQTAGSIAYTYYVPVLNSYTVTIDDATTSTYNMTLQGPSISTLKKTVVDTELDNTKGTELPHTGGIGTTIFYIVGGILLIGAAVILVARRKAQD